MSNKEVHDASVKLPISNFDDPCLVSPQDAPFLSQFELSMHSPSREVVIYINQPDKPPDAHNHMVFVPWIVLVRHDPSYGGILPFHPDTATSTSTDLACGGATMEMLVKDGRKRAKLQA